ncbi:low affinity Fe/Cu permease [Arthrobacter nitrophenolicus]|uniref:Low affinity Fe/Cu permease n=1 Tax=Arthrobacter nitrophenolicus TaxID=683150 RepID=A0ACC6TIQ8_9MICC
MKPLEAPRAMLVFAGIGTLMWGAFGLMELFSDDVSWRIYAYLLMTATCLYMVIRAVLTIRQRRRSEL